MREVFFSHASQDHVKASQLRDRLVLHGVQVWFAPRHIKGAQQWQDKIGAALARCDWFMVALTPAAIQSMWVRRELQYALMEKRYQERIIPLLFKECDPGELSWTLPQFQIIDFTKDGEKACEQLLRIWKIPLKKQVRKKPRN